MSRCKPYFLLSSALVLSFVLLCMPFASRAFASTSELVIENNDSSKNVIIHFSTISDLYAFTHSDTYAHYSADWSTSTDWNGGTSESNYAFVSYGSNRNNLYIRQAITIKFGDIGTSNCNPFSLANARTTWNGIVYITSGGVPYVIYPESTFAVAVPQGSNQKTIGSYSNGVFTPNDVGLQSGYVASSLPPVVPPSDDGGGTGGGGHFNPDGSLDLPDYGGFGGGGSVDDGQGGGGHIGGGFGGGGSVDDGQGGGGHIGGGFGGGGHIDAPEVPDVTDLSQVEDWLAAIWTLMASYFPLNYQELGYIALYLSDIDSGLADWFGVYAEYMDALAGSLGDILNALDLNNTLLGALVAGDLLDHLIDDANALDAIRDSFNSIAENLPHKFPFCIPADVALLVGSFNVGSVAPYIEIPLSIPPYIEYTFVFDGSEWLGGLATATRWITAIGAIFGLMWLTRFVVFGGKDD